MLLGPIERDELDVLQPFEREGGWRRAADDCLDDLGRQERQPQNAVDIGGANLLGAGQRGNGHLRVGLQLVPPGTALADGSQKLGIG